MGLDVYLEKCADRAEADRLEAEYERRSAEVWDSYGEYNRITEEQKDEARAKTDAIKEELGLVDWGTYADRERIKQDSASHPNHYFKVGYFRSSYNGSGFNNVMREYDLPDLYDIFTPNNEYHFAPDWQAALNRTKAALVKMRDVAASDRGKYGVMDVSACSFDSVTSDNEALSVFFEEAERDHPSDFRAYSNRAGTFYLNGITVHGFIPGTSIIGQPCVYVVFSAPDRLDWYIQALEIVQETIEHVLAQDDIDQYYLVWSS